MAATIDLGYLEALKLHQRENATPALIQDIERVEGFRNGLQAQMPQTQGGEQIF